MPKFPEMAFEFEAGWGLDLPGLVAAVAEAEQSAHKMILYYYYYFNYV